MPVTADYWACLPVQSRTICPGVTLLSVCWTISHHLQACLYVKKMEPIPRLWVLSSEITLVCVMLIIILHSNSKRYLEMERTLDIIDPCLCSQRRSRELSVERLCRGTRFVCDTDEILFPVLMVRHMWSSV